MVRIVTVQKRKIEEEKNYWGQPKNNKILNAIDISLEEAQDG
jgi:hypothetical protein